MPDDYSDNTQTTGTVTVGGSTTGEIEPRDDRDWFAVTLEADKTYLFEMKGSWTSDGTLWDPYLVGIYNAEGTLLDGTTDDNGGEYFNSRVRFTASADGTYYVSAGTTRNLGSTYLLSVKDITDDFADGTDTAGTVAVDGSVTSEIDFVDDRDWFAVTLVAGNIYRFNLGTGGGGDDLYDPYLRGIYNARGTLLPNTTDDDGGVGINSQVTLEAPADGTYYVSASGHVGVGTYTLAVTDVTDSFTDDFTAGIDTTGAVTVGASATGEIEPSGDRDWFAVTLEADKTYLFDLEGSSATASMLANPNTYGTLWNPYLYGIYDSGGSLINGTTNNDAGYNHQYNERFSRLSSRVVFRAPSAGTYYVSAGASGELEGTYTLSVTDVTDGVSDGFTEGTDTAGRLAVDGSVTGDIGFSGEHDWFAVTLEMGRNYRFHLKGSQTNDGTLYDPVLRGIHNAAGGRFYGTEDYNSGTGRNSQVTFEAHSTGTYYVSAGAVGKGEGTYTLSVMDITDSDFTAGIDTAGAVAVGGSVTSEIETVTDTDWFAVTLTAGQTYRFDLEGSETGGGTLRDPVLQGIYNADGSLIEGTHDDDGGGEYNSRMTYTASDTATYYVSARGRHSLQGTYKLSVTDITDDLTDDFTAGLDTTGVVTVGGSATGNIDFWNDRDWFAVTLEARNLYLFDLEGSSSNAGGLYDPYLRGVYNAAGTLIEGSTNDDSGYGLNSRVLFLAVDAGTYYVSAGAYGGNLSTYTLSVTDLTAFFSGSQAVLDDFTAGTERTGTVAVDGSATGVIERNNDRDWFAVTLEAGNIYQFDMEGRGTNAGTLYDPYLRGIYDAQGNYIRGTESDDGGSGLNSRMTFAAPSTGTYYVSAGAFFHRVGTYRLSVTDVTDDLSNDLAAGTSTTGRVTVGGSAVGEIDYGGDQDWFAVTLVAGTTYQFDLVGSGAGGGTLRDPHLRGIHHANGNLIDGTTDDDSAFNLNSRVTYTATSAGTYYVSAGAFEGGEGTYTLSVEEVM